MKEVYQRDIHEIEQELHTHIDTGLSQEQVSQRRSKFGPNRLQKQQQKSLWKLLLDQITNPVMYLLTAASILAFTFGDVAEGIAILVVLFLNTLIGFWMEYQAQKSMKGIQDMDRLETVVIRDNQEVTIDSDEVIPGDILILKAGNLVSADARLFEVTELKIDESPMTGESVPVLKKTETLQGDQPLGDRINLAFKGTAVTGGTGKALVFATGMNTEMGKIATMVNNPVNQDTPLNKKLNSLTQHLIWVILAMAAAFFMAGWLAGKEIYLLIQTSIAWAIAAIPEGLPIVASIALARGMYRLARQNVLVKKLAAVETLGETTVIFTDKTGTLTHNELAVRGWQYPGSDYQELADDHPNQDTSESSPDPHLQKLLQIAVLANDASLSEENTETNAQGDPLEIALLSFAQKMDSDLYTTLQKKERTAHIPFSSETMLMGTAYHLDEGLYMAAKGSADTLLPKCSHLLVQEQLKEFTSQEKEQWLGYTNQLSENGLRVLAFAYSTREGTPTLDQDFLQDLTFTGLIGFIDPPRAEVANAIQTCYQAGIQVVMVTGDHPGTSKNVAHAVGILSSEEASDTPVVHGNELQQAFEQSDANRLLRSPIFSRVDPGQKLQLITYYQNQGAIVGMTGDGVNDAPALKKADIGIAMGKRGTQVAQDVADVVLKEDQFSSIVSAIEQGRIIFGNIRRFILYQLSYHFAEILLIAGISFTLFVLPILPLQLLLLNLLSDVFPALALGIGEGHRDVMHQPPKDPNEAIVSKKNWVQVIMYGSLIAASVTGAYVFTHRVWNQPQEIANNVHFSVWRLHSFFTCLI